MFFTPGGSYGQEADCIGRPPYFGTLRFAPRGGNAKGPQLVGHGIFPAERRRIYESRICPGLPGKQLVAPGGRLLGNGRIVGAPRRIERRLVPATRVQRRDVCHFREGPSLPERASREEIGRAVVKGTSENIG